MTQMAPPLWRLPPAPRDPTRKSVGVAAVLLLHLVAALALLQASLQQAPALRRAEHEITFWFLPPPKPKVQLPKPPKPAPHRNKLSIPLMRSVPDVSKIFLPPSPQTITPSESERGQTLQGLDLPLVACAPENLDKLSPEARANCMLVTPFAKPDDSVDYADHTDKSKNAERWARGKARKNAPALLPCANPQGLDPLGTVMCLGKVAIDGKYDPDAAPGYADQPSETHLPNNGDPPPMYRDPDH